MATVTAQKIAPSGLAPAYAAVNATDEFAQGNDRFLHVKNGGVTSINVTIDSIEACSQGFDHNLVVAVPAGQERLIGPLTGRYADANGMVAVSYSAQTSVTAGVFEL